SNPFSSPEGSLWRGRPDAHIHSKQETRADVATLDDFRRSPSPRRSMRSMSSAGEEITNPVTGEQIAFLQTASDTGGELLEFDDFWSRPEHRVPEHAHPEMEERWEVVGGLVRF